MEVVTGGSAGVANVADDVAAFHLCAALDGVVEQMPITRLQTETMIENDQVAVAAVKADVRDGAVRGREYRLTALASDIKPRVEIGASGDGIGATSHCGGKPPFCGPDRRCRRRQRVSTI